MDKYMYVYGYTHTKNTIPSFKYQNKYKYTNTIIVYYNGN